MRPAGSSDGPAEVLIVVQRLADFPMMPEGIHDSPQAPTVGLILTGQTTTAPAATACSLTASGSSTITTILEVPPPRVSGLKLKCSGDRPPAKSRISPGAAERPPLPSLRRAGIIPARQTPPCRTRQRAPHCEPTASGQRRFLDPWRFVAFRSWRTKLLLRAGFASAATRFSRSGRPHLARLPFERKTKNSSITRGHNTRRRERPRGHPVPRGLWP